MPIYKDTYGYGNFTLKKLEDFDKFIQTYLAIAKAVIDKNKLKNWCNSEFHYIDMNAGPGILPDLRNNNGDLIVPQGTMGSPFAFTKWAESYWASENQLKYRIDFIESNLDLANNLARNFIHNPLSHGYGHIWAEDHSEAIKKILQDEFTKWKFGLIYHDPNNGQVNFDILRYCMKFRPKYEILINYPGSLFKRRPESYDNEVLISDCIDGLKDVWMIKDLAQGDIHQWTFLLGTDYTQMKDFENVGMYRIHRPKGAETFERVNYSKRQLKKKLAENQLTLPIESI